MNGGHSKENINNKLKGFPFETLFCDENENRKKFFISKNGEEGKFIESFIGNKEQIKKMKNNRNLGNLLNYKLFVGKNFDDLHEKLKEIIGKSDKND